MKKYLIQAFDFGRISCLEEVRGYVLSPPYVYINNKRGWDNVMFKVNYTAGYNLLVIKL